MIEAGHVIEIVDNRPSSHGEVRELVAKWVQEQGSQRPQPDGITLTHAQEVGEEIRDYTRDWYGILASDEDSFPGGLLARLLSLVDWAAVGSFYLDDYFENARS